MKRASIFFYILLIFLQVQCGSAYLLFDSYKKKMETEDDISPLLALLIGSGGLLPLNVKQVSWINFSASSLQFSQGAGETFTISIVNPLNCSLGSAISVQLSHDGVPLTLGQTDAYSDGCMGTGVAEDSTISISGTTVGKGRVIAKLASNIMFSNYPGLYAGQIVGVVKVAVSSTAQTVTVTSE
ncbi:hypothetical protein [Leptospira andrefontaineae]|uniref:Uncharacterized protein n=1 Tax=Leptospira andrefontaineae TaxID=2484976 RepID=A0A4R9H8Y2_9LEPT|nr:hypothetical protein [Leptospira andrefontaineae]TGK42465.1 hypothetical protein EHO65_06850 [Leptospira andrefontaineae]